MYFSVYIINLNCTYVFKSLIIICSNELIIIYTYYNLYRPRNELVKACGRARVRIELGKRNFLLAFVAFDIKR